MGKGQSLLEVVVALGAVIVILSAITTIVLSSLKQSQSSTVTSKATQYAQEGLELAKGRTDLSPAKTYCINDDNSFVDASAGTCTTQTNIAGKFRRQLVTGDPSTNTQECKGLQKLTVTVSWSDAACSQGSFCHSVPLTTCI